MSRILVANVQPGAGASTIAAGIGHRLAMSGRGVRLVRLVGNVHDAANAEAFATFEWAQSPDAPMSEADLPADDASVVTVIEAPDGSDGMAIAERLGARAVLVTYDSGYAQDGALVIANHQRYAGPRAIPEDRLLAAPTVRRLVQDSGAQVLSRSEEGEDAVCQFIVAAAISHDAADTYFNRYPRRAVVCRVERVDLALAAMLTRSECLILTGGEEPSPYLLDRAAASRETTLLLAPEGTVETLRDIEGAFGRAPFSHDSKVERISELLSAAVPDGDLASLAGS
ncbi:MAG: DRTGG domain-containing protein [Chloroflexi bacterium]|nr:DRTGG domain-containing protein [Chloroflexota bacterium]